MFEYETGYVPERRGRVTLQHSSQNSRQATFFLRDSLQSLSFRKNYLTIVCSCSSFVRADKPTYSTDGTKSRTTD